MIISDLNYLETVTQTSSVVGGGAKKHGNYPKTYSYYKKSSRAVAANYNYTEQNATAVAKSEYGPATSVAINQNKTVQNAYAVAK